MAIKNASDLLVYKKTSPAQPQITRIKVKSSAPLKDFTSGDEIKINNITDGSGDIWDDYERSIQTNSGQGVLTEISTALVSFFQYTATGQTVDGSFRYIDFTNGANGPVPTLEVLSGTAEFKNGAIVIDVIQSGQSLVYQPIAYSTSASISMSTDLRDITTKDSQGWQENAKGLGSFEMSTDALWDVNNAVGVESAVNDLVSGDSVDIKFSDRVRNLVATEEVYGDGWSPAGVLDETKHLEDPFNQFTAAKFKINTNTSFGAVYYSVPISLVEGQNVTWSFYLKGTSNCQACNFRFYENLGSGSESAIPFTSYSTLEGQGSITAVSSTDLKITGLSTSAWTRVKVTSEVISGTDFRSLLPILYPGASIGSQTTSDEIITASWQVETGTSASDYQNPTEVDCYQGKAFVNSVSIDAGVEDNATYSASFTGTSEFFVNGLGHELLGDNYFDGAITTAASGGGGTNYFIDPYLRMFNSNTTALSTITSGLARVKWSNSSSTALQTYANSAVLDVMEAGKTYELNYNVSALTNSSSAIDLTLSSSTNREVPLSVGSHKIRFTIPTGGVTYLELIRKGTSGDVTFDFISLKEVFC